MSSGPDTVALVGANGLVGRRICEALADRGVPVRAIVRRAGTAPQLLESTELVGDFSDPAFAASAVSGTRSVITTVHPMGSDRAAQQRVGVQGTTTIARAAVDAGVDRLVHISTTAVYDRSPDVGDVDEASATVADDAGDYAVVKRDADRALADVDGITRLLVRPPAILGPGSTSVWNTLRPQAMREQQSARRANPDATFAWVHVSDLASFAADLADGTVAVAADPARGPIAGECLAVNVAGGPAVQRDYVGAVTRALELDPVWEATPAWTGQILTGRARGWGWAPVVELEQALEELAAGLTTQP